MAKYNWQGNVLTIDLEDTNVEKIVFDVDKCTPEVQQAAMRLGFKTGLRNSTAGKLQEDVVAAHKAIVAKAAVFLSGVWTEEKEAAAKVALTDAEKDEIIGDVIVKSKQAKGDKRTPAEIITAFGALPDDQRKQVVASLQKLIDKRFKAALRDRKQAGKVDAGTW